MSEGTLRSGSGGDAPTVCARYNKLAKTPVSDDSIIDA